MLKAQIRAVEDNSVTLIYTFFPSDFLGLCKESIIARVSDKFEPIYKRLEKVIVDELKRMHDEALLCFIGEAGGK